MCVSTAALQDNLCNVTSKVVVAQSAASVAMDVLILAIPITLVSRLHMSFGRKFRVIALFSTGIMYEPLSNGLLDCN